MSILFSDFFLFFSLRDLSVSQLARGCFFFFFLFSPSLGILVTINYRNVVCYDTWGPTDIDRAAHSCE